MTGERNGLGWREKWPEKMAETIREKGEMSQPGGGRNRGKDPGEPTYIGLCRLIGYFGTVVV